MTPEEMKQRRNDLRLTQAELADRIGITTRHYQRIEAGDIALTGAMAKVIPLELQPPKRKPITVAEFRKIKDELTLSEIANVIRAMGSKIKIQHPCGLTEAKWATADYISGTHKEILIQSKINDNRFQPRADHELMKRMAVCLYDMTELVMRCKFDDKGQQAIDQVVKQAIDIIDDATYPVI